MAPVKFREHRALAKSIAERKRQIRRLTKLVSTTTKKFGKEIERVEGSSHIKSVNELKVGNYRITATYGMTCMGGNAIDISFEGKSAFKIYWQSSLDDCSVEHWDASVEWYGKLANLLADGKRLKRQMEIDAGSDPKSRRAQERERARKNEKIALNEYAKQLGLGA